MMHKVDAYKDILIYTSQFDTISLYDYNNFNIMVLVFFHMTCHVYLLKTMIIFQGDTLVVVEIVAQQE